MDIIQHPSPNFDDRQREVDMLVLHYTGMKSSTEALERLCDSEAQVSAHYLLEENGDIYQLVEEEKRAWHAGISFWRGVENVNHNSIGIEIVNPGHEFGYRTFTEAQYESLIPLCKEIKNHWDIADHNIIGHSDIAPERKQDPGELFNWELLARNNIGLWPNLPISELPESQENNLIKLGYKDNSPESTLAFQRHWRPWNLNGEMDEESCKILANLLESIG